MDFSKTADALIALINSSPYSPRKDQIVEVLKGRGSEEPRIKVLGCHPNANIVVTKDDVLQFNGWQLVGKDPTPPTGEEVAVAILDFLREAVLAKRVKTPVVH